MSMPAPGRVGPNEDAALVVADGDAAVLVVADGAGGYGGGELASAAAIDSVSQSLDEDGKLPLRARILNGVERAHARLVPTGAATTLVVVEVAEGAMRTYHVGDSGVLVCGGRGRIKRQTIAHSPTGYGVESGLLSEHEALTHGERHVVSNLLGLEPMSIEVGLPLQLAPRDTVVIASDGLFDNVFPDEIAALAHRGPLARACGALARLVAERMDGDPAPGKVDDLTLVLVRPR